MEKQIEYTIRAVESYEKTDKLKDGDTVKLIDENMGFEQSFVWKNGKLIPEEE